MTDQEKLEKAKAKSLAHHFKKAAAHHEGHAADDEKSESAHKAHAEAHEKCMGKADDSKNDYHKASAAFHKSMANFAAKMGKREKEYAEHNKAMGAAVEANDAKKIYESFGIEIPQEETPVSTETVIKTETPTPAPVVPNVETPATPANINETISKALDSKLGEAVSSAFERVLNSEDFNQRVDKEIAKKLLEKLGSSTVETPVKTFPISRPGESNISKSDPDYTGISPEFFDLIKSE